MPRMVGGLAQLFAYGFGRHDEQQSRSPADSAIVAVRLDDVQALAKALGWARRRLGSRQMKMHDKVQTLAEEAARCCTRSCTPSSCPRAAAAGYRNMYPNIAFMG